MRNVYDFDNTIYHGDSTKDFYFYCLRRNPVLLLEVPRALMAVLLYSFGLRTKTEFKIVFFRFLKHVKRMDSVLVEFWNKHESRIAAFYLDERANDDIVISASPEFLLKPIMKRLGIHHLIASKVNPITGEYDGYNCDGHEKVRRFREEMPGIEINKFYSDSLSDAPLASLATLAFIVKGNRVICWSEYVPSLWERLGVIFRKKEFMLFVFCGGIGTIVNFLVSLYFSTVLNPTISYLVGYSASLFVTYGLNARLIFNEYYRVKDFIKFVLSYIPNFLILFTFVATLLNVFDWNKVFVYAIAGILGIPVTFVLVKVFAFGRKVEE